MSDIPTAEEIERVRAHHQAQATARGEAARREREAKNERDRAALASLLVGRSITAVAGEVEYGAWRRIVLTLSDGLMLAVEPTLYDDRTLDLDVEPIPKGKR